MKKLYQTLTPSFTTLPLTNPEFVMLKCPDFLMKLALDETPARAEKFCYIDYYQQQQMNLLKKIGINFTQIQ